MMDVSLVITKRVVCDYLVVGSTILRVVNENLQSGMVNEEIR